MPHWIMVVEERLGGQTARLGHMLQFIFLLDGTGVGGALGSTVRQGIW